MQRTSNLAIVSKINCCCRRRWGFVMIKTIWGFNGRHNHVNCGHPKKSFNCISLCCCSVLESNCGPFKWNAISGHLIITIIWVFVNGLAFPTRNHTRRTFPPWTWVSSPSPSHTFRITCTCHVFVVLIGIENNNCTVCPQMIPNYEHFDGKKYITRGDNELITNWMDNVKRNNNWCPVLVFEEMWILVCNFLRLTGFYSIYRDS